MQERGITELVKKLLLGLVWKPLRELEALGTDLHGRSASLISLLTGKWEVIAINIS